MILLAVSNFAHQLQFITIKNSMYTNSYVPKFSNKIHSSQVNINNLRNLILCWFELISKKCA